MIESVTDWLTPLSRLSPQEAEYVRALADESAYRPELLLSEWPDVLDRARQDPVMAWKVQNLRKRRASR